MLDRARQPDADAGQIAEVATGAAVEQRAAVFDDPSEHGLGAEGDVEVDDSLASIVAARSVTARRTWVAPMSAAEDDRGGAG